MIREIKTDNLVHTAGAELGVGRCVGSIVVGWL
jgi:hypothetical protein